MNLRKTELWVTILTIVGAVAADSAGALPERYTVLLTAISSAAYTISRGIAKHGADGGAGSSSGPGV